MDLVINTSSLSEMENETQNFYINQIERIELQTIDNINKLHINQTVTEVTN